MESFSWVFSGNPSWPSSKAVCRHFVWQKGWGKEGGLLAWAQQRCITVWTHRTWVANWAQHCNSIFQKEPLPSYSYCLGPNCDCQTLYWIMRRDGESMSLLSLEDERAGNGEVAVLWGPVCGGPMKTCTICHFMLAHNKGREHTEWDKACVFSGACNTR